MNLPDAGIRYDPSVENQRKRTLEQADERNLKRGEDILVRPGRLILVSPSGLQYQLKVSNTGVLSAVLIL